MFAPADRAPNVVRIFPHFLGRMSSFVAMEHEDVALHRGRRSGVTMVIAVHSRALGPAVGGCRLRRYVDWRAAVDDALRLSEAMSYKCAVVGLPFGGGKSVVALDEHTELTPALRQAALEDLGEHIASFDGAYLAGPDVGTGPEDMLVLRRNTPHVFCLPEEHGGTGSSSAPTAIGVLASLRAGALDVFGTASVTGRTVVISGFGAVGSRVAESLAAAGAHVLVSDVDDSRRGAASELGLGWVEPGEVMATSADILIPAAVGGVLSREVAATLDIPLIVGPANNQLVDDSVADVLAQRGVVWIPDFVAGAGGVVYTLGREVDGMERSTATARVEAIGATVTGLLTAARANGTTPLAEARKLAGRRLGAAAQESGANGRQ
jgi:valine dehydrogenase (NAD+)